MPNVEAKETHTKEVKEEYLLKQGLKRSFSLCSLVNLSSPLKKSIH